MIEHAQETQASYFDGFKLTESSTNSEITMPVNWPEVAKAIDNLAELKVAQLVLWVTWGNGQPDALVPLTIEDIMECTGLSQQSVRTGIDKALEHGYIVREIEYSLEDGRVRQIRYYGLKLAQVQNQDVAFGVECEQDLDEVLEVSDSADVALEADCSEVLEVVTSSNNSNNISINNCNRLSRIQSLETLPERVNSNKKPRGKSKYPDFIRSYMESFSSDLGDLEHTAPNIAQATNIYLAYIANGGNAKAFMDLMIQAKETTQKKSCIKHKNSSKKRNAMPYYFACLRNAAKSSPERIVVENGG